MLGYVYNPTSLKCVGIYTLIASHHCGFHVYIAQGRDSPPPNLCLGQVALYAVLYDYNGLLTAIALLLEFHTRKVKVKDLDHSKYITASIYVTYCVGCHHCLHIHSERLPEQLPSCGRDGTRRNNSHPSCSLPGTRDKDLCAYNVQTSCQEHLLLIYTMCNGIYFL